MKEALKLALEIALEKEYQLRKTGQSHMIEPVITAIKEALAQDELCSSQEPVAWEQFYPDIGKPQLKQEPVAIYRAGQAKGEGFHVEFLKEMGDDEVLLYTTPKKRPWVGLTDAEMFELSEFRNAHGYVPTSAKRLFARIEAKLKEKNT